MVIMVMRNDDDDDDDDDVEDDMKIENLITFKRAIYMLFFLKIHNSISLTQDIK